MCPLWVGRDWLRDIDSEDFQQNADQIIGTVMPAIDAAKSQATDAIQSTAQAGVQAYQQAATSLPKFTIPSLSSLTSGWSDQTSQPSTATDQLDTTSTGVDAPTTSSQPAAPPLSRFTIPNLTSLLSGWEETKPPETVDSTVTSPPAPSGAATVSAPGMPTATPSSQPTAPVSLPARLDTSSRDANLAQWAPALQDVERRTGLRADALGAIIQAENGGGQSPLSANDNNYFSISYVNGRPYQAGPGTGGRFARYATPQDSLNDFVDLIQKHYPEAWANRSDPAKFFAGLVKGGYIVEEPGFPVSTWMNNLETGRQHFAAIAPAPAPSGPTAQVAPAPPASGSQADDVAQAALDDPDKWALCGPVAAVIAAQTRGQNWTVADAKRIATAGNLWDASTGMHGLESQVTLLNRMSINAKTGPADQGRLAADAQAGNTPIISTNKHYFVLKGYDPATGRFDTTTTGTALKGGSRWLTLDQISNLGNGIQGAAYIDNPTSPTPSVVASAPSSSAGAPSTSPTSQSRLLSQDASTSIPSSTAASSQTLSPSASDTASGNLSSADQPTMYRQPLTTQAIVPSTPGQPPDPSQPDPEASRSDIPRPGMEPVGYQNGRLEFPFDPVGPDTGPPWEVQPAPAPTGRMDVPPGTMYRQPLLPTDPDASTGSGTAAATAPPVRDDYATAGSSVPAMVPAAQVIPQEDPTAIPRPAYVPPAMPLVTAPEPSPPPSVSGPRINPLAGQTQPPQPGELPQRPAEPSPPSLLPVWDAAQNVVGYVQAGAQQAVSAIPVPSSERVAQNIRNIASGEPLQPSNPASESLQQSARDITTAVQEPIKAALEAAGIDPAAALQAAQDASNVLGPGGAAVGMVRRGAGRAANVAREAAGVLPEGARAIASTEAQDVARLRLDKFPSELRGVIQDAAASTDFAQTQRRGVIPDVAAEGLADDITRSVDQWINQGKAGKALNTEETRALRNVMTGQAQKVADLAQQVTEADSAGVATNLLIVQAHAEAEKLAGLVQYVEGARAEAGRSLRAWRAEPRPTDPNAAAQQIFKKFGTGPEARQRAIDALAEFQQIPQDDPIAQANFWARIERGNITSTDVLTAIRYNSMLSSPRTWEVGWIGSMLQAPFKAASDVLAATTRPTSGELPLAARGAVVGFQRGLRPLLETITQGITSEQAAGGAIPRGLAPRATSTLGQVVGTAIDLPGRMTAAPDALFSSIFREAELGRQAGIQAYRQGLTGDERSQFLLDFLTHPPKSVDEQITRTVDRMMLRGDMGTFGNVVQSFGRNVPGGELYKSLILPFVKVAYSVWTQGVEMTPVGAVGTALDVGRGALGRGPYAAGFGAEQAASHVRPLAERLRYNAMGLGVTGFALGQAYAGNISADGPSDPGQKAMLRSQGWQPYSVRIGGTWYGYSNWGPVAVPLASAAAIAENQQYRKPDATPEKDMLDMTTRVGKLIGDQSFISGIGTLVNAYQEPDRYLPQFLANMATSFVPYGSALNVAGQATDPTQRRPERVADVGPIEFGKQAVEARLPGLRQNVPAAQDVLGRPAPNDQTGVASLEPFRFSNQRADPTIQLFQDAQVNIPTPKQALSLGKGIKIDLVPAEQRRWNELRGQFLSEYADAYTSNADFMAIPAAQKQRYLQRFLDQASQYADRMMMSEIDGDSFNQRVDQAVEEMAS